MNEQFIYYAFASSIIAISNFILSLQSIADSIRNKNFLYLFWASSLYVAGIPILIDSLIVTLGYGKAWSFLLNLQDENYIYSLHAYTLFRISFFVLSFNALFKISLKFFDKIFPSSKQTTPNTIYPKYYWSLIPLFIICGWFGFFIFYFFKSESFTIIYKFFPVFLSFSCIAVFFSVLKGRYLLFIFSAAPSVIVSYITTERPYIIPVLACAIAGFVYTGFDSQNRKKILRLVLIGFLCIIILNSVLSGRRPDLQIKECLISALYPVVRDSSTNVLYYCFDDMMLYDKGTEFRGILYLIGTGFMPSSLFGNIRDFTSADVPSYLALKRFGWPGGSIHPTIYGWAFTDMKWYGILFSIFIGFFLGLISKWSQNNLVRYGLAVAGTSIFVAVGLRGSVQVGFARCIYVIIFGFLLCKLIEPKKYRLTKRNLNQ